MEGVPGETLSIVLSDLNDDTYLDLLIGNDFSGPDSYFWGKPNAQWKAFDKNVIPEITFHTMSISSGDIENDLKTDTYHGQITVNPVSGKKIVAQRIATSESAEDCKKVSVRACNVENFQIGYPKSDISLCAMVSKEEQLDCIASVAFMQVSSLKFSEETYNLFTTHYAESGQMLEWIQKAPHLGQEERKTFLSSQLLPQLKNENLLYVQEKNATFKNRAEVFGVSVSGWTWNAKFADLDGDSFQDLFVVNGSAYDTLKTENVWFKNHEGKHF